MFRVYAYVILVGLSVPNWGLAQAIPAVPAVASDVDAPSSQSSSLFQSVTAPIKKLFNSWGQKNEVDQVAAEPSTADLQTPLKIRSIHYLAGLDDNSYPHVVDSLLASLDDNSEEVRFEATQAILDKCTRYQCAFQGSNGFIQPSHCDCSGCRADQKVMQRMQTMLLSVDPKGKLVEQSERIRDLAVETMLSCLNRHKESFESEAATVAEVSQEDDAPRIVFPKMEPLPLAETEK